MARLLVVSRSMALALRLADTHDVVEAPVDDLAVLRPAPDLDAVVLDVGEPALAVQAIDRLRRDGDATPLLVVSGYQAAWAGLTAVDVPGVVVVPLPVTRAALLEGIDRLLAGTGGTTGADPRAGTEPDAASTSGWHGGGFDWWDGPPDGEPAAEPLPAGALLVEPLPAEPLPAEPAPVESREVLDLSDGADSADAADGVGRVDGADGADARPLRRGWPARREDPGPAPALQAPPLQAPALQAPAAPGPPVGAPVGPPPVPDVAELVEALAARLGEVLSVTDAARAVADRASTAARAAACAVLVPDGPVWRVGGGHGLRAVERAMVLPASHWLVEAVASADRPILLDDTDVVRRPGGVPLAAWRHLLVAPVPRVRVLVVLARAGDGVPFDAADLHALAGPLADAAPLLRAAMQARYLARRLAPLQDVAPQQ